jgi:hypothetical protein
MDGLISQLERDPETGDPEHNFQWPAGSTS